MSGLKFWSRDGEPMELTEWARAYEKVENRTVALDIDEPDKMVSTIWEGMNSPLVLIHDHTVPEEPHSIFETAYLVNGEIVDKFRWASLEGALEGHRMVCIELLGREPRPEDGWVEKRIAADRRPQS